MYGLAGGAGRAAAETGVVEGEVLGDDQGFVHQPQQNAGLAPMHGAQADDGNARGPQFVCERSRAGKTEHGLRSFHNL